MADSARRMMPSVYLSTSGTKDYTLVLSGHYYHSHKDCILHV